MISSLYDKYFQKSKVFLYPLLELPKTNLISLTQTYIIWENIIRQDDYKLICLYDNVHSNQFIKYENKHILDSKYFIEKHQGKNNQAIYIFNLSDFSEDWYYFLKGKYSRFSEKSNLLIQRYYGVNSNEYKYINTFLNPSDYVTLYSKLLNVSEQTLKEVGELCDVYDINKEFLKFTPINLEIPETCP